MARLLVTYYSRGGPTAKMAELIAEGASEAGAEVKLKKVEETTPEDLLAADGIAIGSPTYYGAPAALIRQLFDVSVKYHGRLEGKVGGAFASSANIGGGNETTILSILQSMLIHGMVIQGSVQGDHYGPVSIGAPDERATHQCRSYGKMLASLILRLNLQSA